MCREHYHLKNIIHIQFWLTLTDHFVSKKILNTKGNQTKPENFQK